MDLTPVKGSSLAQQLAYEALPSPKAEVGQLGVLTHSRAGAC